MIFDCVVDQNENCFPMIPSGRAHNEMILGDAAESIEDAITEEGKVMVSSFLPTSGYAVGGAGEDADQAVGPKAGGVARTVFATPVASRRAGSSRMRP